MTKNSPSPYDLSGLAKESRRIHSVRVTPSIGDRSYCACSTEEVTTWIRLELEDDKNTVIFVREDDIHSFGVEDDDDSGWGERYFAMITRNDGAYHANLTQDCYAELTSHFLVLQDEYDGS